jgi:hypothetical protein
MRIQIIIGVVVLAIVVLSGSAIEALIPSQASPGGKVNRPQPGSIDGRVVDPEGKPVEKAKLHVVPVGGIEKGRVIFYWSRKDGRFSIDGLEPGVYDVFVSKEDEGYADTQMFFYSTTESQPTRVVVSDEPSADVTVRLGPKAGRIKGEVRDSVTGAPINEAAMTFRRPENKNMFLSTSLNNIDVPGTFDFLLPAAPLTMKVTAPGYEDWTYRVPAMSNVKQDTDLLKLEPGQSLQLSIKMKRIKK